MRKKAHAWATEHLLLGPTYPCPSPSVQRGHWPALYNILPILPGPWLAKGQKNSKILLQPRKPGKVTGEFVRSRAPFSSPLIKASQGLSRFVGLLPLPSPKRVPVGPDCLRLGLARPLPASRRLSASDQLPNAQIGQGRRSLPATPRQAPLQDPLALSTILTAGLGPP